MQIPLQISFENAEPSEAAQAFHERTVCPPYKLACGFFEYTA
jgi:hypothetical protein